MALSFTGVMGGFAEGAVKAKERDRREQASELLANKQIMLPRILDAMKNENEEKDKLKNLYQQILPYAHNDPNLAKEYLSLGSEELEKFLTSIRSWESQQGKTARSIEAQREMGLVPDDYTPTIGEQVPFDTIWNESLRGKPGDFVGTTTDSSRKEAILADWGQTNPDVLMNTAYQHMAGIAGLGTGPEGAAIARAHATGEWEPRLTSDGIGLALPRDPSVHTKSETERLELDRLKNLMRPQKFDISSMSDEIKALFNGVDEVEMSLSQFTATLGAGTNIAQILNSLAAARLAGVKAENEGTLSTDQMNVISRLAGKSGEITRQIRENLLNKLKVAYSIEGGQVVIPTSTLKDPTGAMTENLMNDALGLLHTGFIEYASNKVKNEGAITLPSLATFLTENNKLNSALLIAAAHADGQQIVSSYRNNKELPSVTLHRDIVTEAIGLAGFGGAMMTDRIYNEALRVYVTNKVDLADTDTLTSEQVPVEIGDVINVDKIMEYFADPTNPTVFNSDNITLRPTVAADLRKTINDSVLDFVAAKFPTDDSEDAAYNDQQKNLALEVAEVLFPSSPDNDRAMRFALGEEDHVTIPQLLDILFKDATNEDAQKTLRTILNLIQGQSLRLIPEGKLRGAATRSED